MVRKGDLTNPLVSSSGLTGRPSIPEAGFGADGPQRTGFPAFAGNDDGCVFVQYRARPSRRSALPILLLCALLFRQQRLADLLEFAAVGLVDFGEVQIEPVERADDG